MSDDVVIVAAARNDTEAQRVIGLAARELEARYGDGDGDGDGDGEQVSLDELSGDNGTYLRATIDGVTVGGCGFRFVAEAIGEVKRLWIDPSWRRHGIATILMDAIEAEMVARGCRRAILETGERQPEALALYPARGWQRIADYPDGVWKHPGGYAFELVLVP